MGKIGFITMLAVLALAGLLSTACGQQITADDIVAKMKEVEATTTDAHAVLELYLNAQGTEQQQVIEFWEKKPAKFRAEVRESSEAELVGAVMVADGRQLWAYSPAENEVMVGQADEMKLPGPQEMIQEASNLIQQVMDASDATLLGEEEVAGHDTYKLELKAREGIEEPIFPGGGVATAWVDKERWIVLKATYTANGFGSGSLEVRQVEFNTGLDDSLFTFTPPPGAKVTDIQAQQPVHMTLAEAQAQADFTLLVPAYVPGGATLIDVFAVEGTFVLRYNHTDTSFTIVQGEEEVGEQPLGNATTVTVRDQAASLVTDETMGNTFLSWTENGVHISIAGHISQDEALEVAESLQ